MMNHTTPTPVHRESPKSGILTIVGPTAVGKSSVALLVAEQLGGEIVSADSRQIYRHMNIGTAKSTPEERRGVAHHMIDVADPGETYDAAVFASQAERVIGEITERGAVPIVVGGTGFYIASLFEGFFEGPGRDERIRRGLNDRATRGGTPALHAKLATVDPETAERLHPNDTARVVRALEVYESSGRPLSEWQAEGRRKPVYIASYFGLVRPRSDLYTRIDARVDSMMESGLLDEVRRLTTLGKLDETMPAANAVGYQELIAFLGEQHETLDEAVELIKRNTRHYAKRQLTWFAGVDGVVWIDVSASGAQGAADEIVARWTEDRNRFGEGRATKRDVGA